MKVIHKIVSYANFVLIGVFLAVLPLAATIYLPFLENQSPVTSASANVVDVQVGANMTSFSPQQVTIHVGDSVRWTWVSDTHTVTSGSPSGVPDGKFCSPNDANCSTPVATNMGSVYQHTFTQAGTYPYYCAFHVASGMTGTVVVLP